MDYKYIEQLLERYFQCETTLKEEEILRSFFSQEDVPVWLVKYQVLFNYEAQEEQPLGDDFDEKILTMIEQKELVAIILTLGNAAQAPWDRGWDNPREEYAKFHQEVVDSADMLGPIQADNTIPDSIKALPPEPAKY